MNETIRGNKVYRLPVNGLIANCHTVLAALKEEWGRRGLTRVTKRQELLKCFPGLADVAAQDNLLDGFYLVDEDGSVLVDNVSWGRR